METECCICLEETQDKINCQHKLCQKCYQSFQLKECPICFKKIELILRKKIRNRNKTLKPPFLLPKNKSKTLN